MPTLHTCPALTPRRPRREHRWLLAGVLILAGGMPSTVPLGADEAPIFSLVAPGVTAAPQPKASWIADSNATIVIGSQAVLVIDAPSNPATVRRTIARVEELTDKPVRYLVNTHWHSDHTEGNQIYRERYGDSLVILGHQTLAGDVPERAGGYIEEQRARLAEILPQAERQLALGLSLGGERLSEEQQLAQREGIEAAKDRLEHYAELELETPQIDYDTSLTLHLGGREVRLIHFQAHTAGDTVAYLPAEKILVSGDLLDVMPYAGHGFLEDWVATLDTLAGLDIDKIVPGHGPVFDGKRQLLLLRDYFAAIVETTRAAIARGDTLEEAQAGIDLDSFRQALAGDDPVLQRNFDVYAPETVARAYEQLSSAGDG